MPNLKRLCALSVIAAALIACSAADARAQGFFIPLIGYDYGGDSTCPGFTGCENKKLNYGVAIGKLGRSGGFEEEFAYAKDFFSRVSGQSSGVLTIMSNFMVAAKIGPAHPYILGGVGLMKAHIDLGPSSFLSFTNNTPAWDIGAGVLVFIGQHFGFRGDIRHLYSFSDIDTLNFSTNNKLDFGRASIGLVLAY